MTEATQTLPATPASLPRPVAASAVNVLVSVKFAVTLVLVIAGGCVIGTLVPQGAEVAGWLQKHPDTAGWVRVLHSLGLTHVFSSWWFIALLATLGASVAACSLRRLATVRRAAGATRTRALGSMLVHVSILLILAGGVVRGLWGVNGTLELREGETKNQFTADAGALALPFSLQLAKFEVERYEALAGKSPKKDAHQLVVGWPARRMSARVPIALGVTHTLTPQGEPATMENTWRVTVLRYVPDFTMNAETRAVMSRSDAPENPAILVAVEGPDYHNHRWLFARYPDFGLGSAASHGGNRGPLTLTYAHPSATPGRPADSGPIKSFKSTVNVVENGQVVATRTVEVNQPFTWKGYTFYQSGYNPDDRAWTSLQVARDPGVPLVYAGFALMIGGLFVVFYLNPWLHARRRTA